MPSTRSSKILASGKPVPIVERHGARFAFVFRMIDQHRYERGLPWKEPAFGRTPLRRSHGRSVHHAARRVVTGS